MSKKKVMLRGPILSTSGYGVHARTVLRALRKYEDMFDIYVMPCNWGQTSWMWEDTEERRWVDEMLMKTIAHQQQKGQYDITVQVTIPNEWVKAAPINIGVTAGIESNMIAPIWIEKANIMDKIVVVSEFAKTGFEKTVYQAQHKTTGQVVDNFRCLKPVNVVNYPATPLTVSSEDHKMFSFETDFNFLCVAQWGPRKNIENTIGWFIEEFYNRPVGLVLKLTQRNNSILDKTATAKRIEDLLKTVEDNKKEKSERKCKIYLIHGYLTEKEMAILYTHPKIKATVNISHGEGAGLPLLEAASYGVPVIAPEWSGYLDFLQVEKKDKKSGEFYKKSIFATVAYDLKPIQREAVWKDVLVEESKWAYCDENSYKSRLREVYYEYPRYKLQAKALQKHIVEKFTEEKCYREYAELINGGPVVKLDTSNLPKISILTSVFNGLEYLPGYFEDIKKQIGFEQSEFILIHPKTSKDFVEEEKIILKEIKENSNIKYKQLEEDPGLYGCWNEAIKMSTGELISNWNIDDRRSSDNFVKCGKELFLNSDIDCVYYDWLITNTPNETFDINSASGKRYNFPQFSWDTLKMMNVAHAGQFYRKSVFDKYGLFDAKYKSAGDWDYNLKIAQKGCQFKKMDGLLGLYYFSPRGLSTDPANNKWKREEEREVFKKYKDLKVEEK